MSLRPPVEEPSVPLDGISIAAFEAAVRVAQNGRRVWRNGAPGFRAITKSFGNVPSIDGFVTAVLDIDEKMIGDGRVIAAAVWDNVRVLSGEEEGCIGKVTAFRAGADGDGTDDVYIVESILEAKFDARLLKYPNLGWGGSEASKWPQSWLDAKVADKAWQKESGAAEYVWPSLTARAVRLELRASAFERFNEYLTTDDLCKLVVLPRTIAADGATTRSFCELLGARWRASSGARGEPVARATHFVSHAWKYDARRVAATLREWSNRDLAVGGVASGAAVGESGADCGVDGVQSHRFWFDSFVLDQHAAAAGKFTSTFWFHGFSSAIETMGHSLPIFMPWRNAIPLTRAWCVYEIAVSAQVKARMTFLLPPNERSEMLDSLSAADRIHQFVQLNEMLAAVALERAEGGADDRAQIMAFAEEHGMSRLNGHVCTALREWLLRSATAELARMDAAAVAAEEEEIAAPIAAVGGVADAIAETPSTAAKAGEATEGATATERYAGIRSVYVARSPMRDAADAFCKPLANMHQQLGMQDLAAPLFHRYMNLDRRRRGEAELVYTTLAQSATWSEAQTAQSHAQAVASMRNGLAMMTSAPTVSPNSEAALWIVEQIAMMLRLQGKVDEAVAELRRALRGSEETHGDMRTSQITLRRAALLADALAVNGDADGAALLSKRVEEARAAAQRMAVAADAVAAGVPFSGGERTSGRQPWLIRPVTMGDMLHRHGGLDDTLAQLLAVASTIQEHGVAVPCDVATSLYNCLLAAGRAAEALPHIEAVHAARVAGSGSRTTATLEAQSELAFTYMRLGRIADAVAQYTAVHVGKRRTLGAESGATLQAANNAAALLLMVHVDEGADEEGGGGEDLPAADGGGARGEGPVAEAAVLLRLALDGASRATQMGISTNTGMGAEGGNAVTRAIAENLCLALDALPGARHATERAAVQRQHGLVAADCSPEWRAGQMSGACGEGEIAIQRAVVD